MPCSYLGNRCGDSESGSSSGCSRSRWQGAFILVLSFGLGQDLLRNQCQLTGLRAYQHHTSRRTQEKIHKQIRGVIKTAGKSSNNTTLMLFQTCTAYFFYPHNVSQWGPILFCFGPHLLSCYAQKYYTKMSSLCLEEEIKSFRFRTTLRFVNKDRISIFVGEPSH